MELGDPGSSRAFLNDCVLNGTKRATAGLLSEYIDENEPWEHSWRATSFWSMTTSMPLGLIEVTRVEPTTFSEVTWAFAEAEGEGFTDLEDWRKQHLEFWARSGQIVTDKTPMLCIYFDLLGRSDGN